MLSNNRNTIIAIVILSAVILLLCILCVTLVYDKNTDNSATHITPSYQATDTTTEPKTSPAKPIKAPTEPATKATAPTITVTQPATIKTEPSSPTQSITQNATQNTTQNNTEPYTQAPPTQPSTENAETTLAQLIINSGYTPTDIEKQEIEQLIVITDGNTNSNTEATAYMFSFSDNSWIDENLECAAYVGSGGIGNKQTDSDNITPAGLYSIGEAFYTDTQPSTWLNTFVITENTYWVTDINSEMYNKKVEGELSKDFGSAIHMIEHENNRYGCVINYNTNPVITGKGSAIFMHCGTGATNGNIALEENNLLEFLKILNSEKNPHILILNAL